MPKYKIPVTFISWGVLEIEAESLEKAKDLALTTASLPKDTEYVDESLRLDTESVLFGEISE